MKFPSLGRQRGASIMELTVVITLFLLLVGVLYRTELSPDGASIFSGISVGMFEFIAVRTIEITSCADANMSACVVRLFGIGAG
jgi:hypothetical protein